jgi:hypothetical protein
VGDAAGNTLHCRRYHLNLAADGNANAKATHCPHAARISGGDDTCGSAISAFCNDIVATCEIMYQGVTSYPTMAECTEASANFPTTGAIGAATGNTLQCRDYHVLAARTAMSSSDTAGVTLHCGHASRLGGPDQNGGGSAGATCGTHIDGFCNDATVVCPAQYASTAACHAAATAFPTTTVGVISGNTLQCRDYHLGLALRGDAAAKATHCPDASVGGGSDDGGCAGPVIPGGGGTPPGGGGTPPDPPGANGATKPPVASHAAVLLAAMAVTAARLLQ